jgi:cell division protein FtsZ
MSAASAPAADRKTWQGPGDVTIEERAPVFHESPAVAAGGESVGRSEGPEFAPQAPLEVRRPQRRVPEIDEFPPIGQKEYKAKSGVAANGGEGGNAPKVYKAPNETGSKKGSLLQRLMGGGKSRDSAPERAETGPKRNELPDFFGPQKKSG